jgi:hypothetical protein
LVIEQAVPEAQDPVSHMGAGAGLKFPAIATVPLETEVIAHHELDSGGVVLQISY